MKFTWEYTRTEPHRLSFKTLIDGEDRPDFGLKVFNLSAAVGRQVVKWMIEFLTEEDKEFQAELYPEGDELRLVVITKHGSVVLEPLDTVKRYYKQAVKAVEDARSSNDS